MTGDKRDGAVSGLGSFKTLINPGRRSETMAAQVRAVWTHAWVL